MWTQLGVGVGTLLADHFMNYWQTSTAKQQAKDAQAELKEALEQSYRKHWGEHEKRTETPRGLLDKLLKDPKGFQTDEDLLYNGSLAQEDAEYEKYKLGKEYDFAHSNSGIPKNSVGESNLKFAKNNIELLKRRGLSADRIKLAQQMTANSMDDAIKAYGLESANLKDSIYAKHGYDPVIGRPLEDNNLALMQNAAKDTRKGFGGIVDNVLNYDRDQESMNMKRKMFDMNNKLFEREMSNPYEGYTPFQNFEKKSNKFGQPGQNINDLFVQYNKL